MGLHVLKRTSRFLSFSALLFSAVSALFYSSSPAISGDWWEEYEQIEIENMSKGDLVILLARLGASEEQISRNVYWSQGTEFQKRRSRKDFLSYVFSKAAAGTKKGFWVGVEKIPALLSKYDFDREMYSVCPSVGNNYWPKDSGQTLFGSKITNAEIRVVWPAQLDFSLGDHNWSCGDASNRGAVKSFESSFSGQWTSYGSNLDLPISDILFAERLRGLADRGELFFSFKCTPAAVPLVTNLTQGNEGSSFHCHILSLALSSKTGDNIASWDFNLTIGKWERVIQLPRG